MTGNISSTKDELAQPFRLGYHWAIVRCEVISYCVFYFFIGFYFNLFY